MIESDGVVGDRHSGTQKAAGTRNELTFFSFALLFLHLFWYHSTFCLLSTLHVVFLVFADIVIQDIRNCVSSNASIMIYDILEV